MNSLHDVRTRIISFVKGSAGEVEVIMVLPFKCESSSSSSCQPPTGFSPKARSGRETSCYSSYGSLPQDARDQTPPRTEGSPIRGYASIEVSNV